ncbi:MAG: TolC family protein [Verrucomicrobiota bacterium]
MRQGAQRNFASVDRPLRRAMLTNVRLRRLALTSSKGLLDPPGRWLLLLMVVCGAQTTNAVTLENAMQATLDKNPAIQEAKSNLELAAGQRLILRSIMWPGARLGLPGGLQGGKRAGESTKLFGFARGAFGQPLFNAAIPASLRRGDVDLLIARQQLNVAVVEQLHAARLAFYTALYNRSLQAVRADQRQRLEENVVSQNDRYSAGLIDRSALAGATVQARELDPQIEVARRAYAEAQLILARAMGVDLGPDARLPEPEGELQFKPMAVDLNSETTAALERRADLKLARLMVRAANEDQRIIEAGYYPLLAANVSGHYIPVTGIHSEGSTRRTDDFISSEIRGGPGYTWRVIDNGKVTGAVRKQRATREINEIALKKLEMNVSRELMRVHNNLESIEARQKSLASATAAADESTRIVQENMADGLTSQLEYRLTQSGYLGTRSGLLGAAFQYNVALAEWDLATGRYFQFSEDTAQNVH